MQAGDILLRDLDDGGILRLTLNDPARRNALSEAMLAELGAAFAEAGSDPSVRVVILAAKGRAFCAGHDMKEMTAGRANSDRGRAYFGKVMTMCSGVMQAIVNCPKPVIAEIAGVALQPRRDASWSPAAILPSLRRPRSSVRRASHIGLFCSTPMVALSRNVSSKHAMEMLLTGDMTSASRAAESGLVNRTVAPEALQEATMETSRKIASKSSMTLATGKRAFYAQREMSCPRFPWTSFCPRGDRDGPVEGPPDERSGWSRCC